MAAMSAAAVTAMAVLKSPASMLFCGKEDFLHLEQRVIYMVAVRSASVALADAVHSINSRAAANACNRNDLSPFRPLERESCPRCPGLQCNVCLEPLSWL